MACWHARDEVVRELDARERGLEVATDVEEGGEGQASARRVARHHHVFGAVELLTRAARVTRRRSQRSAKLSCCEE